MRLLSVLSLIVSTSVAFLGVRAQDHPPTKTPFPFLDPDLLLDQRVQDLLSRLTLEEKASQWFNSSPAIERLGIPAYDWWSECLHGVARAGYATVFPQAIGLGATWDADLMYRVGTATSDEARAKHHNFVRQGERGIYQGLTFWSPNINLFRDPRWGRGMETYGEDPYLTGKLGVAFIRGLQGDDPKYLKLVGTMKHFAVHSGPEPERHRFNAVADERDLRESYLPHFERCVKEANVQSVMCAYNRLAGEPCCGSGRLLKTILREEWGFDGYVTSDCGAVGDMYSGHKVISTRAEAAALAIRSGTDLNCSRDDADPLEAVRSGILSEKELDQSLFRLFRARFKLGMFDPPSRVPYAAIPLSVVGSSSNRALALESARKSIVLLKNDMGVLPLNKSVKRVAVIGPNADDVLSLLGNYYGIPDDPITPLKGIRQKLGSNAEVRYAPGCQFAEGVSLLETIPASFLVAGKGDRGTDGLYAEYFNNKNREGTPLLTRVDKALEFNWCTAPPHPGLDQSHFSVRWSGELIPPVTGRYELGTFGFRGFTIFLDDIPVVSAEGGKESPMFGAVDLEAGRAYRVRIEAAARRSGSHVQILWSVPGRDLQGEALDAARSADVVLVVLGLSPRLEGEEQNVQVPGFKGGDRTEIGLPVIQEGLLQSIVSVGKPVVLVLLNGSALAIPWAKDHVPAIVECWYPGQAGGTALADVLFGDFNPGGRLPVTMYSSAKDLPAFDDYGMEGRTYRFFKAEPLFPFGHGLSYTTFEYSGLRIEPEQKEERNKGKKEEIESGVVSWSGPADKSGKLQLRASVEVKNAGLVAGDEVVQLYVRATASKVRRPLQDLRGFQRISLRPGESRRVEFALRPEDIAYYDTKSHAFVVETGVYEVLAGASSSDIRQRVTFAVE